MVLVDVWKNTRDLVAYLRGMVIKYATILDCSRLDSVRGFMVYVY